MNRYPQPVLAALVLGLVSTGALATDLFRIEAEAAKSLPTQERAWTVAVDPKLDLAGSGHLMLNLPGHAPIRAERLDHRAHDGGHTWHGRAGGKPVTVTMHGGRLHGDFHVGLDHYTLSSERGRTMLSLANRFEAPRDELTPAPKATAKNTSMPAPGAKTAAVDIRILVAYTDAVLAASGGATDVASAAQFMIGQLNTIYSGSVASEIRFSLAGLHRVDYADGVDSEIVLQQLAGDPGVGAARNARGADIVVLLVEHTDFSGRAYMPNSVGVENAAYAFAVVTRSYGLSYYTFAHEVGHVMGLDHGGSGPGAGAYAWGQGHIGYVDSAAGYPEGFVTVMGNIGLCGGSPPCHFVPYFSNPELTDPAPPVRGRALGASNVADSARALRDVASTVEMYRGAWVDDELLYANFEDSDPAR
jgi:hypothetical protein